MRGDGAAAAAILPSMSRMLSTWPVVISVRLDEAARAGDTMSDAAIQESFAAARDEYFALCQTVTQSRCEFGEISIQRGGGVSGPEVSVSIAVIELFPEGFTMSGRIRGDHDEIVADARCFATYAGGVGDAVRDELIAIAHNANQWH
jgi:hypothetical protein